MKLIKQLRQRLTYYAMNKIHYLFYLLLHKSTTKNGTKGKNVIFKRVIMYLKGGQVQFY